MLKTPHGREVLFSGRPDTAEVGWTSERIRSLIQVATLLSVPDCVTNRLSMEENSRGKVSISVAGAHAHLVKALQ